MQNVISVVDGNMCNGCCECIGACAANNISIMLSRQFGHPVPYVAEKSCTGCGECLKNCPQAQKMVLQIS